MAVNGVVCPETFYIAPIAPFDIIVGESWLYRHRGILDYASDALCTSDPAGGLCELRLDRPPVGAMVLPPTEEGTRPWGEGPPQSALHLLSHPWEPRKNSLQVSDAREVPEVVLWFAAGTLRS